MEYKYGYLLSKCKCGEKFYSRVYLVCFACRHPFCTCDCGNEIDSFNGRERHECSGCNVSFLRRRCTLCNSVFSTHQTRNPDKICSCCRDLEIRGEYTDLYPTDVYSTDKKYKICPWCGNLLGQIGKTSNICVGCAIEPLNCSTVKPAKQ